MTNINTNLLVAVQTGDIDRARTLLKRTGDPNYSEESGYTLLHWATQQGDVEMMKLLVKHGAELNAADENGITPLFNASGEGDVDVVEHLLRLGADPNAITQMGTSLHNACAYAHEGVAQLLIENGANVNAVDEEGRTPLFDAVGSGSLNLVQLLLSNGAFVDKPDCNNQVPADLVEGTDRQSILRKLNQI